MKKQWMTFGLCSVITCLSAGAVSANATVRPNANSVPIDVSNIKEPYPNVFIGFLLNSVMRTILLKFKFGYCQAVSKAEYREWLFKKERFI
ncbi:MAG: hypothetical protein E7L17_08645 [Clostridium sp.]|uniref:hypothetical protein n=1 Tax=Clostridium sp. TaxID=1506 RepID=UPI00290B9674|nr:hypothetical protein [Clostridium sp.]MDU7338168.1 hypothetical protein [Clostridium sp.]